MSKVSLIALDIDGTLLDSSLRVSEANRDAIRRATQAGIECVLCSGRSLSEIREVLGAVPEIRYLICANGACLHDLKYEQAVYTDAMSASEVRYILQRMEQERVLIQCYHDNQSYFAGPPTLDWDAFCVGDYRETYLHSSVCDERLFDTFDTRPFSIEKINLYFTNEPDRVRVLNLLSERPVLPILSMRHMIEISSLTANKGNGLRKLCELLCIPIEESLAVGDSENDRAALEAAGVAVAMGNATESLKQIADIVCPDCDHDGVAQLINSVLADR